MSVRNDVLKSDFSVLTGKLSLGRFENFCQNWSFKIWFLSVDWKAFSGQIWEFLSELIVFWEPDVSLLTRQFEIFPQSWYCFWNIAEGKSEGKSQIAQRMFLINNQTLDSKTSVLMEINVSNQQSDIRFQNISSDGKLTFLINNQTLDSKTSVLMEAFCGQWLWLSWRRQFQFLPSAVHHGQHHHRLSLLLLRFRIPAMSERYVFLSLAIAEWRDSTGVAFNSSCPCQQFLPSFTALLPLLSVFVSLHLSKVVNLSDFLV